MAAAQQHADWRAELIDTTFFDARLFEQGCPTDVVSRGDEQLIDPLPYRRNERDTVWTRRPLTGPTVPDVLTPEVRWVTSYLSIKVRSRRLFVSPEITQAAVAHALHRHGRVWLAQLTGSSVVPSQFSQLRPAVDPVASIGWWLALIDHHRLPQTILFVHETVDEAIRNLR